jgi:amino acid transporter
LVAAKFLGWGKVFVILTAASAILAIMGSVMLAGARMLFALSREGLAPAWFGRVHPKHGTPWNAQLAMFALAIVVPILIAIWQGHDVTAAYGWLGQSFVFFVLVPYIFVNLGNILYHVRYRRSEFNIYTNGILPAIGIVIDAWLLYDAFFKALLPLPFKSGSSIAYFSLAWAALGAIWTVAVLARRKKTHTEGLYLFSETEGQAGAHVVSLEEGLGTQ